MNITLLQNPSYVVDLQVYKPKEIQKVNETAIPIFKRLDVLYTSFRFALKQSNSVCWIKFKDEVLGYQGPRNIIFPPPPDIPWIFFRLVYFVIGRVNSIYNTTLTQYQKRIATDPVKNYNLQDYNSEINVNHIRTKMLSIDTSAIPDEITLDDLFTIYDTTEYRETSFDIDGMSFTKESLRTKLTRFIDVVKNRIPNTATPAIGDPQYEAYFQHVENVLRLCIQKVKSDVEAFENAHGSDPALYSHEQKLKHKDLLETQGSVAFDVAYASAFCSARHLAVAMSIYNRLFKHETGEENLEEEIVELLAEKRRLLADAQLQKHYLTEERDENGDVIRGVEAHTWNEYMMKFGSLLGIPNTANIIDNLYNKLNTNTCLTQFFEFYTINEIIDTIQTHVKSNANFRGKIIDWIRGQIGNWKKEEYQQHYQRNAYSLNEEIKAVICDKSIDISTFEANYRDLQKLLDHLKAQKNQLPEQNLPEYLLAQFKYLHRTLNPEVNQTYDDFEALTTLQTFIKNTPRTDDVEFYEDLYFVLSNFVKNTGNEEVISPHFEEINAIAPLLGFLKNEKPSQAMLSNFWKEVLVLGKEWCSTEFASVKEEVFQRKFEGLKECYNKYASQLDELRELIDYADLTPLESSQLVALMQLTESVENTDLLFDREETKNWCRRYFQNEMRHAYQKKLNGLLEVANLVGGDLLMDHTSDFTGLFVTKAKAQKINAILAKYQMPSLDKETIVRILEGKIKSTDIYKDRLEILRQNEFIYALRLQEIATEGLPPEIMEWLLVSHGVLLPQQPPTTTVDQAKLDRLIKGITTKSIIKIIGDNNHVNLIGNYNNINIIGHNNHFSLSSGIDTINNDRNKRLNCAEPNFDVIFDKYYSIDPEDMISKAKNVDFSAYPAWKTVVKIILPKVFIGPQMPYFLTLMTIDAILISSIPLMGLSIVKSAELAIGFAFQYAFEATLLVFAGKVLCEKAGPVLQRIAKAVDFSAVFNFFLFTAPTVLRDLLRMAHRFEKIMHEMQERVEIEEQERYRLLKPEVKRAYLALNHS